MGEEPSLKPAFWRFQDALCTETPVPTGYGVISIGKRGIFGSRDSLLAHQPIASFPKRLKERQDIFGHLQKKRSRVTHHLPGHLVDLPADRLDLGSNERVGKDLPPKQEKKVNGMDPPVTTMNGLDWARMEVFTTIQQE